MIYPRTPLGALALALDLTWSLPNTLAGFLVWLPLSQACGGRRVSPGEARRSGCVVVDRNPRGGVFAATTVGTVVAGEWSLHEELHVWQARLFGPAYLVCYALAFVLNALFRLLTLRLSDIVYEAYARICFEDWAYWGAPSAGDGISWRGCAKGFVLSTVFVLLTAAAIAGWASDDIAVGAAGAAGLTVFAVARGLQPSSV